MSKDIKDYLHLYLGCDIALKDNKENILRFVSLDISAQTDQVMWDSGEVKGLCHADDILLCLRPLSGMTEEEWEHWYLIFHEVDLKDKTAMNYLHMNESAEETKFLLSRGFDVYRLIESGLAIDKTKLK